MTTDPDMSLEDGESVWDKLVQQASSSIPPNEPRYPGQEQPYLRADAAALVLRLNSTVSQCQKGELGWALPIDIGLAAVQSEIDCLLVPPRHFP